MFFSAFWVIVSHGDILLAPTLIILCLFSLYHWNEWGVVANLYTTCKTMRWKTKQEQSDLSSTKRSERILQGTLRVSVSSRSRQRQNKCWGGCCFFMSPESIFLGKITLIKQKPELFWPPLKDFQWAEWNIRWVEDITASSGLLLKRAHSHYGLRRRKRVQTKRFLSVE